MNPFDYGHNAHVSFAHRRQNMASDGSRFMSAMRSESRWTFAKTMAGAVFGAGLVSFLFCL